MFVDAEVSSSPLVGCRYRNVVILVSIAVVNMALLMRARMQQPQTGDGDHNMTKSKHNHATLWGERFFFFVPFWAGGHRWAGEARRDEKGIWADLIPLFANSQGFLQSFLLFLNRSSPIFGGITYYKGWLSSINTHVPWRILAAKATLLQKCLWQWELFLLGKHCLCSKSGMGV